MRTSISAVGALRHTSHCYPLGYAKQHELIAFMRHDLVPDRLVRENKGAYARGKGDLHGVWPIGLLRWASIWDALRSGILRLEEPRTGARPKR